VGETVYISSTSLAEWLQGFVSPLRGLVVAALNIRVVTRQLIANLVVYIISNDREIMKQ